LLNAKSPRRKDAKDLFSLRLRVFALESLCSEIVHDAMDTILDQPFPKVDDEPQLELREP
jgi:hypothetical protein